MPRALGLLFGTQDGRDVSILETVEIAYGRNEDGSVTFRSWNDGDTDQLQIDTDMQLFTTCYPSYECLGWYCCGALDKNDVDIHHRIAQYNERPIFLVLSPEELKSSSSLSASANLPMAIYEEAVSLVDGQPVSTFVRADAAIESDEAERITMIHCAKVINNDEQGSTVTFHYSQLLKSVTSLVDRIKIIHRYLSDVKAGRVPADQPTLRAVKGLLNRLPTMTSPDFRSGISKEYIDGLLISMLASMTKATSEASTLSNKFNIVQAVEPREGRGRREMNRMDEMSAFGGGGRTVGNFRDQY